MGWLGTKGICVDGDAGYELVRRHSVLEGSSRELS